MAEEFVIPPPPRASAAIAGATTRFPVRRIFCVALNYADHAREMGKEASRDEPSFSPSRPTRWFRTAPRSPTRRKPPTFITRSNWWRP